MDKMKDAIGQELDIDDLVAVVWANGNLTTARVYGFKTRKIQKSVPAAGTIWIDVPVQARVVTPSGSRKPKYSDQIIKIDKLAMLDHNDKLVLR